MHLVHRHVVDRGFGLRQVAQDGDRVRGGAGTERRGLDARHHVAKAGVSVVVVMVMVVVMIAGRSREPEAQAVQAGAGAGREDRGAGSGRQHGRGIRQHAGPQIRQGVNHGGGKHVARNAAHRVEADGESHQPAKTGTT